MHIWIGLTREEQHLAKVLAAHRAALRPPVFSHISAATVLGLPAYRCAGSPVHITTAPDGPGRPTTGVIRHRASLGADDVVSVGGVLATSPDRTILDLARSFPEETALASADAHLRGVFRVHREVDQDRLDAWRGRLRDLLAGMRGRRGVRRARDLLELADPRKDSVLESVSHLQLRRLGFEVSLQVPIPSPTGGMYHVDFELRGLGVLAECDGRVKYVDPSLRAGRTAEEVVLAEKRRHDWIVGTTDRRLIRWEWGDVASAVTLARRLRAFGVPIPRPP